MALKRFVALATFALAVITRPAFAQDADVKGRALFEEGKHALEAKDYPKACSKFEQSYVVSGVPGALLSWADCEEKRERFATALSLWQQGEAKVVSNEERRRFVRQRQNDILSKVSWLDLRLPAGAQLADLRVTLDGKEVDLRHGAVPVDAGRHEVVAVTTSTDTHRHAVELAIGQRLSVDLFSEASIVKTPSGPEPQPSPQPPPGGGQDSGPDGGGIALLIAGSVVGGVGVLGFVGFGVTGGLMLSSCGDLARCPASERDSVDALGAANAATLGIGIAGVATGVVLIAVGATTPPPSTEPTVQVTGLRGIPGTEGLLFTARF